MDCTEEELEALLLECQVDNPEFNKADLRLGLHKNKPNNVDSKDWISKRWLVYLACRRTGHRPMTLSGDSNNQIIRCRVCQTTINTV